MTEPRTQHHGNHTRFYPLYHYFALPVTSIYAIYATYQALRAPGTAALGLAVYAWAIASAVLASRVMALRVQDRVIRLEEAIRMQRVLPAEMQGGISKLSRRQIVALRFAPDDELPDLVRRTLAGELPNQKSIKQAIKTWRADWLRA